MASIIAAGLAFAFVGPSSIAPHSRTTRVASSPVMMPEVHKAAMLKSWADAWDMAWSAATKASPSSATTPATSESESAAKIAMLAGWTMGKPTWGASDTPALIQEVIDKHGSEQAAKEAMIASWEMHKPAWVGSAAAAAVSDVVGLVVPTMPVDEEAAKAKMFAAWALA